MASQRVWVLVPREKNMNVLGCMWVYKTKRESESGAILRERSRLVAKGFKERYGIEYFETFSSNVRLDSVRLLLAIAAFYDLEIGHFDIRKYFLYGDMEEEVYMEQPPGYEVGKPGELVCKLQKAIYGTKQAQRCADKKLEEAFEEMGVKATASDARLYVVWDDERVFMTGVYVDDGLCICNDKEFMKEKLSKLEKHFEIQVVMDPKAFVGIQIERDRTGGMMLLHQEDAVRRLIEGTRMVDCIPAQTPMQVGLQLPNPADIIMSVEDKEFPFQSVVGQLIWLLGTRLDCSYAINVLTRYMGKWDREVINAAKRVVRYLVGRERMGLQYRQDAEKRKIQDARSEATKMGFKSDSDHAGRLYDSKSTAGGSGDYGGNTYLFYTKTQKFGVATSTCQAESLAVKVLCNAIEWILGLAAELRVRGYGPAIVEQDNKSVIELSKNPIMHKRSKHFRIALHYFQDLVARDVIKLRYVCTNAMAADILTKALSESVHSNLLKIMNFGY